ncbi:hypothetical protein [Laceyella putida]|uniref:Uncharacterized protein n=1 Tax=Laceyella putida TaxID=110101 RepID=A0ABW2RF21_9BACL
MKKFGFVMVALLFTVGSLFVYTPKASADYDQYFDTDDDVFDNTVTVYSGQDVKVKINSCNRVNWNNNSATPMPVSDCGSALYAKLCNGTTSNCITKHIGSDGIVWFTNMRGPYYLVYIYDSWPSYHFEGSSDTTEHW